MAKKKLGQRVKVTISAPQWVPGAVESMNGLEGEITALDTTARPGGSPYLVTFQSPPRPWWSGQHPSLSWWFAENELEVLP